MKHRYLITSLVILFNISVLVSQEKSFTKHSVSKGETISQIATRYNVTPYDIYKLNPDAQSGIQENDLILIPTSIVTKVDPVKDLEKPKTLQNKIHITKPKETLYSIARDYNINVSELKILNTEAVEKGLKIGQTIKIPVIQANVVPTNAAAIIDIKTSSSIEKVAENKPVSNEKNTKDIFHIVEPKETKFGIAKKYGITVQELEQRNPKIVSNLPVGTKLIISGAGTPSNSSKAVSNKPIVEKPKPVVTEIVQDEIIETKTTTTRIKSGYANYEVKQGETIYSLAQYFKITEDELLKLNPTLIDGVKLGMILKVPGRGTIKTDVGKKNKLSAKSKTIIPNTTKKSLVLLLPFNAEKIKSDTLKTVDVRLKKDAFLNMTLDFYSGALIAIDSARTLGLNVDVKIFDSEESKISSNVENIIKNNNLQQVDAVIGPFYQQYIEKTAALLSAKNVPVISPLSKEIGKGFPNLYQAMPPSDYGKAAMFNYMIEKNGNILVVSDPKKLYNKEFISKNYPVAKFVTLLDNGALDVANLKSLIVKDRPNFVVIDSERTGLILGTTNVLLNELSNFQIQLAIIEPNETLDFEEVSMKRLTILKLLSPSLTRENNSIEATNFEKSYRNINKVFPNQYAIRGFDVTFDTLIRITQNSSFESAATMKSEQIESKFEYSKNENEGYTNKGVYIFEYQEDLTVKQMN